MGPVLPWLIVVFVWSLLFFQVSSAMEWDDLAAIFGCLMLGCLLADGAWGSYMFLQYMQAWPFIPQ
jgi:hypothetical protein